MHNFHTNNFDSISGCCSPCNEHFCLFC